MEVTSASKQSAVRDGIVVNGERASRTLDQRWEAKEDIGVWSQLDCAQQRHQTICQTQFQASEPNVAPEIENAARNAAESNSCMCATNVSLAVTSQVQEKPLYVLRVKLKEETQPSSEEITFAAVEERQCEMETTNSSILSTEHNKSTDYNQENSTSSNVSAVENGATAKELELGETLKSAQQNLCRSQRNSSNKTVQNVSMLPVDKKNNSVDIQTHVLSVACKNVCSNVVSSLGSESTKRHVNHTISNETNSVTCTSGSNIDHTVNLRNNAIASSRLNNQTSGLQTVNCKPTINDENVKQNVADVLGVDAPTAVAQRIVSVIQSRTDKSQCFRNDEEQRKLSNTVMDENCDATETSASRTSVLCQVEHSVVKQANRLADRLVHGVSHVFSTADQDLSEDNCGNDASLTEVTNVNLDQPPSTKIVRFDDDQQEPTFEDSSHASKMVSSSQTSKDFLSSSAASEQNTYNDDTLSMQTNKASLQSDASGFHARTSSPECAPATPMPDVMFLDEDGSVEAAKQLRNAIAMSKTFQCTVAKGRNTPDEALDVVPATPLPDIMFLDDDESDEAAKQLALKITKASIGQTSASENREMKQADFGSGASTGHDEFQKTSSLVEVDQCCERSFIDSDNNESLKIIRTGVQSSPVSEDNSVAPPPTPFPTVEFLNDDESADAVEQLKSALASTKETSSNPPASLRESADVTCYQRSSSDVMAGDEHDAKKDNSDMAKQQKHCQEIALPTFEFIEQVSSGVRVQMKLALEKVTQNKPLDIPCNAEELPESENETITSSETHQRVQGEKENIQQQENQPFQQLTDGECHARNGKDVMDGDPTPDDCDPIYAKPPATPLPVVQFLDEVDSMTALSRLKKAMCEKSNQCPTGSGFGNVYAERKSSQDEATFPGNSASPSNTREGNHTLHDSSALQDASNTADRDETFHHPGSQDIDEVDDQVVVTKYGNTVCKINLTDETEPKGSSLSTEQRTGDVGMAATSDDAVTEIVLVDQEEPGSPVCEVEFLDESNSSSALEQLKKAMTASRLLENHKVMKR